MPDELAIEDVRDALMRALAQIEGTRSAARAFSRIRGGRCVPRRGGSTAGRW